MCAEQVSTHGALRSPSGPASCGVPCAPAPRQGAAFPSEAPRPRGHDPAHATQWQMGELGQPRPWGSVMSPPGGPAGCGPLLQGLPGFPACTWASASCPGVGLPGVRAPPPQGSLSNFSFLGSPRCCSPPSRGGRPWLPTSVALTISKCFGLPNGGHGTSRDLDSGAGWVGSLGRGSEMPGHLSWCWRLFGGSWCQVTEGPDLAEGLPQGLAQSSRHSGAGKRGTEPKVPKRTWSPWPYLPSLVHQPLKAPRLCPAEWKGPASSPRHAGSSQPGPEGAGHGLLEPEGPQKLWVRPGASPGAGLGQVTETCVHFRARINRRVSGRLRRHPQTSTPRGLPGRAGGPLQDCTGGAGGGHTQGS